MQDRRDAEVEELGLTVLVDHHVGRLEIPVDDQARVRVLHTSAHGVEQLQPLGEAQALRVGVRQDVLASDKLHDQEGLPALAHAAVEQPRDVGVAKRGEHLALAPEAPAHLPVEGVPAQELDDDLLLVCPVGAVCPVDHPHPAHTDPLFDLVWPETLAPCLTRPAHRLRDRAAHEPRRLGVGSQQRLDLRPQRPVRAAHLVQHRRPLVGPGGQRPLEHLAHPIPVDPGHASTSPPASPASSRCSQARARRQSVSTVP